MDQLSMAGSTVASLCQIALASWDHNFQLPVCSSFSHNSFIIRVLLLFDLNRFYCLYVFLIASFYFLCMF